MSEDATERSADALDDLVARLNDAASHYHATRTALFREAVTEITALRARVDRAEESFKTIALDCYEDLQAGCTNECDSWGHEPECAATNAAAYFRKMKAALAERNAENRALREALRNEVVHQLAKPDGNACELCGSEWTDDESERHAADCLAKE